jgi:dTDP-4-dehydrorhamnose reductase
MIRILLLGARGQLGWELERTLSPLGNLITYDFPQVDFRQIDSLRGLVQEVRPSLIINAAAYTDVDQAESEPQTAMAVNSHAPGVLAELAKKMDASLIHFSTDYVFDGKKGAAYVESDLPDPLNVYGNSKWIGEQAVAQQSGSYMIFRTSWVYSLQRENFVTKIIRIAQNQESISIVTDQVSCPTWSRMLAEITALFLAKASAAGEMSGWINERKGLYHLAGDGHASRYEWAQAILKLAAKITGKRSAVVKPALTKDFPAPAQRPLFSALDCDKFNRTFELKLPPWESALTLAMEDHSL